MSQSKSENIEINSALYGGYGYDFWAYIADNEEEYRLNYAECGMSQDIYKSVDFENYIMVMSINRPLSAIRIMKNYPVWEDGIPYSYPQFVFDRNSEKSMVYYYKVYRIDSKYKKKGQEIISRLKLWMEPYSKRNSNEHPKPEPMIESWGLFKKWNWSFELFNNV